MKKKILIANKEAEDKAIERLKDICDVFSVKTDRFGPDPIIKKETYTSILSRMGDIDILFSNISIDEGFLNEAKKLQMIQRFGIGYDNVDIVAAKKNHILVCNVPEFMSESIAQHVWALILTISNNIMSSDSFVRAGIGIINPSIELYGKTLGIIGLGSIGTHVAMKGRLSFNMEVLAYDPYVSEGKAMLVGAKRVDLETLLKKSDVISINCNLTKETMHMIGEKELQLMKKNAIIVNTARGSIIDEEFLIKALDEKRILGAGLDVFENEPLSFENKLMKMKNVVLTPHTAAFTDEAYARTAEGAINNIIRFINGQKPLWIVNSL